MRARWLAAIGVLSVLTASAYSDFPSFPIVVGTARDYSNPTPRPAVSGQIVAWVDTRNGGSDIYAKDLATGEEIAISGPGALADEDPAIDGETIVYSSYSWDGTNNIKRIVEFDLVTRQDTLVSLSSLVQIAPQISGDIVVWQDGRNGHADVYGKNLGTGEELEINVESGYQWRPDVSGDTVVWYDGDGSFIRARDLTTGLTRTIGWGSHVRIDGNIVVWHADPNGELDIFGYDLGRDEALSICTNPARQNVPDVDGSVVVWADARNQIGSGISAEEDYDIYGFDLVSGQEFPIYTGPGGQVSPVISGDLVVWYGYEDGAWGIYGAYIPEPATLSLLVLVGSALLRRRRGYGGQALLRQRRKSR